MKRSRETPESIHPEKRRRPPMQPVVLAKDGMVRFQANRLVTYLLDNGGLDLNDLGRVDVPRSDRDQFYQLIGYSVGNAPCSLGVLAQADVKAERLLAKMGRK